MRYFSYDHIEIPTFRLGYLYRAMAILRFEIGLILDKFVEVETIERLASRHAVSKVKYGY